MGHRVRLGRRLYAFLVLGLFNIVFEHPSHNGNRHVSVSSHGQLHRFQVDHAVLPGSVDHDSAEDALPVTQALLGEQASVCPERHVPVRLRQPQPQFVQPVVFLRLRHPHVSLPVQSQSKLHADRIFGYCSGDSHGLDFVRLVRIWQLVLVPVHSHDSLQRVLQHHVHQFRLANCDLVRVSWIHNSKLPQNEVHHTVLVSELLTVRNSHLHHSGG